MLQVMIRLLKLLSRLLPSPLLETTIEGATHVIINVSGDMSLVEADEAASYVQNLQVIMPISSLVLYMMRQLQTV